MLRQGKSRGWVIVLSLIGAHSAFSSRVLGDEPCGMRVVPGQCEECFCGNCDSAAERDMWDAGRLPPLTYMTIRVRFVVFRNDDGSISAATPQQVDDQVDVLNGVFRNYGIEFSNEETAFVNSTQYLNFCAPSGINCYCPPSPADCRDLMFPEVILAPEGYLKHAYAVDPDEMLNIYVTDMTYGDGFKGLGYFPWGEEANGWLNGILIDKDWFGGITDCGPEDDQPCGLLVHEIGHNLGLWHTFHGSFAELPNNCETDCYESFTDCTGDCLNSFCNDVGDLCCDTPASDIGDFSSCQNPNNAPDICTEGDLTPADYTNYMHYAQDGCWDHLTPQQVRRMHCWACNAVPGWIDSPDCNNNDMPDVCDLSRGTSLDCDANGVPDECQSSTMPVKACCLHDAEGTCVETTECHCDELEGTFLHA